MKFFTALTIIAHSLIGTISSQKVSTSTVVREFRFTTTIDTTVAAIVPLTISSTNGEGVRSTAVFTTISTALPVVSTTSVPISSISTTVSKSGPPSVTPTFSQTLTPIITSSTTSSSTTSSSTTTSSPTSSPAPESDSGAGISRFDETLLLISGFMTLFV